MKKILVILVMALLLVSCADKEIVGRWYEEATGQYVVFRDDGICDFGDYSVEYKAEDGVLIMIADGVEQPMDYIISKDHLIISIEDFEMEYTRVEE